MTKAAAVAPDERRRLRLRPGLWALAIFAALSALYFSRERNIRGDGLYFYAYTVSILWDGDVRLKNQFDHRRLDAAGTIAGGNYFVDRRTGQAFSLSNPGTGIFMIPTTLLGRVWDGLSGRAHPDPFDPFYQRFAGFSAVIVTALSFWLLFLLLGRFYSPGAVLFLPVAFFFATNWHFYALVMTGWSHVYGLFLGLALIWSFLLFLEKRTIAAAGLFGFCGGLLFATRNFGLIFFLLLLGSFCAGRAAPGKRFSWRGFWVPLAVIGLFFLVGASPQFWANDVQHGGLFRSSFQAVTDAVKPFGFMENANFKVLQASNLSLLFSNLANTENGLFTFHPLYLLGFAGLVFFRHKDSGWRRTLLLLLAGLVLYWLVDAAYYDNWFGRAAGSGFGHRRFVDVLPIFVFGSANLWDGSRRKKGSILAASLLFSLALSWGLVLAYRRAFDFPRLKASLDSIFSLTKCVAVNPFFAAVAAAAFAGFLGCLRPSRQKNRIEARPAFSVLLILIVLGLPRLIFPENPADARRRFIDKRGFFLMSSLNSFVRAPGRFWGMPEPGGRPLNSGRGELRLPAPLESGDTLLFKMTPLFPPSGETLIVFLEGKEFGRLPVRPGTRVYEFPVGPISRTGRDIHLAFDPAPAPRPSALFQEGRIVFKEQKGEILGAVDSPPENRTVAGETLPVEGWALADFGVRQVVVKREPDFYESAPIGTDGLVFLGEGEFLEGTRPEIESTYVLYPAIDRAGWRLSLPRSRLGRKGQARLHVFAVDDRGNVARIGKRAVQFEGFRQNP